MISKPFRCDDALAKRSVEAVVAGIAKVNDSRKQHRTCEISSITEDAAVLWDGDQFRVAAQLQRFAADTLPRVLHHLVPAKASQACGTDGRCIR
ncbi:hypothetical protein [Rhizobium etli]|uniref:hypothetical protein n=1 Tax=Rhizobium etli TaxID=29449 RepID=UPI0009D6812D|nr:hypothetical protein [Rhizobium etli]